MVIDPYCAGGIFDNDTGVVAMVVITYLVTVNCVSIIAVLGSIMTLFATRMKPADPFA